MTDPTDDSALSTPLLSSSRPLARAYDVALLDLDGVCFAGEARIPHAAEGANGARALGMGLSFITNNASRAPQTVVDKLAANDIEAFAREVFTAAMDAAALLRERLEPGARVLVVGGDGVRRALTDEGFTVVDRADQDPAAVVQGWDPAVDWAMMSEGAYAIRAGAIHVATNTDATLPTERGFALGNGSLVAAVANATGRDYLAAGKPFPDIYRRALARAGGERPLAVGDRLNTDHVGARAADIAGLHVLTGVSSARDVLLAAPEERPGFLHTDLRGLLEPHPRVIRVADDEGPWWRAGACRARVAGTALEWEEDGVRRRAQSGRPADVALDAYRALACAVWERLDAGDAAPEVPELRVVGAPRS